MDWARMLAYITGTVDQERRRRRLNLAAVRADRGGADFRGSQRGRSISLLVTNWPHPRWVGVNPKTPAPRAPPRCFRTIPSSPRERGRVSWPHALTESQSIRATLLSVPRRDN